MLMNLKDIRDLIDLLTEKGIQEFELERAGVRLKINRRTSSPQAAPQVIMTPSPQAPAVASPAGAPAASGARTTLPAVPPSMPAASGSARSESSEEIQGVLSPMVGTFYGAPTEGEPSFVEVGDHVRVGQVLCIIEAMKLMNEIESEVEGEVLSRLVDNGQPVEFGQPLFEIKPGRSKK